MHDKIYTAVTIGPIGKTLDKAHKTKEIWLASFIFSKLMEDIIESLKNLNSEVEFEFVLPNIKNKRPNIDKALSPGIFPDRLIICSDNGMMSQMRVGISFAIKQLAKDMAVATSKSLDVIEGFLDNYLSIHMVEGMVPAAEHPIFYIYNVLANQELRTPYIPMGEDLIQRYLENSSKSKYLQEYGSKIKSIEEIAGVGSEDTRSSQYIAIIQADGDNIGKLIGGIKDVKSLQNFSLCLSSFSCKAVEKIVESGGFPIYAGGDDLLWFHPIKSNGQSVYQLIDKIDQIFKEEILDNASLADLLEKENKPSMSYGLSISYYKHPMHEALSHASELLFTKAKKTTSKNSIAHRLMKNSGQTINGILSKDLLSILNNYDKPAFNSVMYNMSSQKIQLGKLLEKMDDIRMHEFFANNYNEPNHKEKKPFFESVTNALMETYAKSTPSGVSESLKSEYADLAIDTVVDMLYIEKFLNQSKHDGNE